MNFSILNLAEMPIPLHAYAAMLAIVLGGWQLASKKGTTFHRYLGRVWVGMMGLVAITSFFITEIRLMGPYSPIHFLSIFTLWSIWAGVRAAQAGRIKRHKILMINLYGLGLVLTGLFTFLPGRTMHQVFFGT